MKLLVTILLSTLTCLALCQTELGVKLNFNTWKGSAVMYNEGRTLEDFLGIKGLSPKFLVFTGTEISNGSLLGGGILSFEKQISKGNNPVFLWGGPYLEFGDRKPAGGLAFGIKF